MTARSIRRAAERKAHKNARLAANRANALLSTGPRTEEGKRNSSLNAVKTGLTGATVLLSSDDAAEYQRHIAAYENELQPAGLEERELVQSLADISWRLRRIPTLEMAIYAQGRIEFAGLFEDQQDPDVRRSLIELHTHLIYEKQIRNLQLQESRLVRRREKETATLRRLQEERKQRETQTANGFEFSSLPGSLPNPRLIANRAANLPENEPLHAADAPAHDAQTRTTLATSPASCVLL
jgi:hypothetical protein